MPLTSKQRQRARGLAHDLDPVVAIGKAGVTDAVVEKAKTELGNHELIKVRVEVSTGEEARAAGEALAVATGADLVQVIGKIAVLYLKRKKKPTVSLERR